VQIGSFVEKSYDNAPLPSFYCLFPGCCVPGC